MERRIPIRRRVGGKNMERRIPIRRPCGWVTGPRGALATMERKLHGFRLKELVAMTSDGGGGSESAFP